MTHRALIMLGASLAAASLVAAATEAPAPQPGPRTLGVALGLFASDPAYDYGPMLGELRRRGATDTLIVYNWYQHDARAHHIRPRHGKTPDEATVRRTIRQARALGLRVTLMPVVRLHHRTAREWRGVIQPAAGVEAWFISYRAFVRDAAQIARDEGVARLVVGSELTSMVAERARWLALIEEVRGVFAGPLLYSANWDSFQRVTFWDALDAIAVTGYFELPVTATTAGAIRREARDAWTPHREALRALGARHKKPVLITELGYPTREDAAQRPWDERVTTAPVTARALHTQAALFAGFCDAFAGSGAIDGVFFWNWFGHGGPTDPTYTPRGKPAAAALARCLRPHRWHTAPSPLHTPSTTPTDTTPTEHTPDTPAQGAS